MKFRDLILSGSLLLAFIVFPTIKLCAQESKESLERDRMRIIEQIEKTSKLLKETSKSKKSTLSDLQLIQMQIENRRKVIDNIQNSLELAKNQLASENDRHDKLVLKYLELKKDYSNLLEMSYKKMLTQNKLVYLLSAKNWDESLKRARYVARIENFLERNIDTLNLTASQVEEAIGSIEDERLQYETLLEEERSNFDQLKKDEGTKDRILAQLQGDEKRLRGALIKQKKDREELNRAIERIILASLHKNDKEKLSDKQSKELASLSGVFDQNRGKLPWPVKNGRVISKYGKQKHPTLENVFISNNGVDIFSSKNALVKAIFEGEVAGSMQIPGNDYMIMIKHGKYYTVYSKMTEIYVSKGDRITAGHAIGKLGLKNATLHFEIWQDKQKLNPEHWLSSR